MANREGQERAGGGVSRRALILGLVLLVLMAPAAFYGELVYGTTYMFGSGAPAMAPLVILFVLAGTNPLLRRVAGVSLSRRELLAVYAIVLVGGALVTHGILGWMLPVPINQQYVGRAIPEWETGFLPYVPVWFCPSDPVTVENFFQGRASVPWSEWWKPLAAWGSFMTALFLSTVFLMVLFQRQWITHERLAFPLAQVPLEMVREGGEREGRRGRLPAGWVFWVGFLISFGLTSLSRLAGMFPAIPDIPLSGVTLMQWRRTGPLAGLGAWELWIVPWMVAVAYLIPKELSFSCWFFWLVRVGLRGGVLGGGARPRRRVVWWYSTCPAPRYLGGGALLALSGWTVWVGRRHLARAVRLAFGGGRGQDADEPLGYRWALIGFALTFGYLVYFCWRVGSRPAAGAAIIGLIIVHYFMWARLRAETGVGFIPFPLMVNSMIVVPFGSAIFRPQEVVTLLYMRWSYFPGFGESFEVCTGNALESFKVADSARISSRALTYAMVGGFVVSLGVGIFVMMTGMYEYGFFNTRGGAASGWLRGQLRGIGASVFTMLTTPSKPDVNGTIAMGAGAAIAILLGTMRLRFWWWPFHPVGYLAANAWGMHWFSQSLFLGWVLKSLAIRYGGLRLFRRTVPLAIGLIVGDFVSQGLWVGLMTPLRAAGVNV